MGPYVIEAASAYILGAVGAVALAILGGVRQLKSSRRCR